MCLQESRLAKIQLKLSKYLPSIKLMLKEYRMKGSWKFSRGYICRCKSMRSASCFFELEKLQVWVYTFVGLDTSFGQKLNQRRSFCRPSLTWCFKDHLSHHSRFVWVFSNFEYYQFYRRSYESYWSRELT